MAEKIKMQPNENIELVSVRVKDYPQIYQRKMEELIEQGWDKDEAEEWLDECEIVLELYYHKHSGLFAVESEACEGCMDGGLYSPYDGTTELVGEDELKEGDEWV